MGVGARIAAVSIMKLRSLLILGLVLAGASGSAAADVAWLLTHESERRAVVRADGNQTQTVAYVGDQSIYGTTAQRIGILSEEGRGFVLQVFDKATQQQVLSRPISSHVLTSLSGASRELALTAEAAFFVTGRFVTDGGMSLGRNNLGGLFDLNRVDLSSGNLTTIPLPEDCANARPVVFAGSVLVYSRNGYSLWRYVAERGRLEQLLSTNDLATALASEQQRSSTGSKALSSGLQGVLQGFADFLPVPGNGVFHLAKSGRLQQVLTLELKRVTGSAPMQSARSAGARIVQAFSGTFGGAPAIGLVRSEPNGRTFFSYVDVMSQKVRWQIALPNRLVQGSVEPAGDSQIAYIDAEKAVVMKHSKAGVRSLWPLQPNPQGDFTDSRILALE